MSNSLVTLKQARKIYRMGSEEVRALDGVSLEINRGEFVAIVGASGSGKSTLMHMLGCLDVLSDGTYHLAGIEVSQADDETLSAVRNEQIGFVFQQFNLLSELSVVENIALPLAYAGIPKLERQQRAREVATEVGLGDRLHHKPHELSGGQAQRVAIARALVNNPAILFADEPTGALDSKTGEEIMGLFRELHQRGRTVVLVTHDNHVAEQANRVLRLRDGKLVEDSGKPDKGADATSEGLPSTRATGLQWQDLLRMGLREGLLTHKLRTALTMLGVIIGVASVIAMSSFSEGSKKKQADQIRSLGANLIRITDRRLEDQALYEARATGSSGLSSADADAIEQGITGISAIARIRELNTSVRFNGEELNGFRVRGVSGPYLQVNNLQVEQGSFLNALDQTHRHRVAVVGAKLAHTLDGTLHIGGQPYRVIGVLADKYIDTTELEAAGANDTNQDILIPLETLLNRTTYQMLRSPLDELQIQLSEEDQLTQAGRAIRRILDARHSNVEDYDLVIPLDLLKSKQASQKLLDVLSLCISAISLVVGGIGIMNIMLAAVTERLREIGIRRAVGARERDIRLQFLFEAVMISAVGGLAGILLAVLGVLLASGPLAFPVVFSPGIMLIAFLASFLTGLGFGAYPAMRAAEQNVVEILQRD